MSKFEDDTNLCNKARNPAYIIELQEDINKLDEWATQWQMNLNVDKCSVMHIGHNIMQGNYNMSNGTMGWCSGVQWCSGTNSC